ncbi:hypothetical protein [Acidocella aminolytica]|jgi:hypothetical protein|uniref:Glycosyl transferase n=1 Tax=Acidocella aminolytica 101 = DSM 11237 TaxID=1120923 RepID=A0A0D6PEF0_9PROT|nr:hypothetical protein [Acidocella aminolytica]GAN80062.1 hypothetical protein Aam_035_069 [Acidocella aminolytica 101 = DSM 11237]GBQ40667.1 hypothetical protein AA11237_2445 [Acidocella aminolytica 101 = DSM 11237]SHF07586.1 hypothetical protein SAMN02746095_02030 [Acidocella aminolytica 101 = DSM 11237]
MTDAIFIVGYYRSGTSALSGALQRAGVKFYNEADPNEHNPLGFYEIPELIELDVNLFNHLSVDWTDVRGLPKGWSERPDTAPFLSRLEEILRQRFTPQDRLWGLKHPHLCRTLPLYERAARQAGHKPHVVHIFREPWVSAASQGRKNGLTRAHALLLWMSYTTDAERLARHLPRCWLTYHDLLAQPTQELRLIESSLGLTFQKKNGDGLAQASSYLTGQLNRAEPFPREGLTRPLHDLVTRTWEAILARDFQPDLWDGLAAETEDLVGFLSEISASRGRALPGFNGEALQTAALPNQSTASIRPVERTDDSAKTRLMKLRETTGALPRLAVLIAAPSGRAPAVNDTLESLRGQWNAPNIVKILSADPLAVEGFETITVPAEPEAMTRHLCEEANLCTEEADYVAIINAGDTIAPDGCLRLAMLAAQTNADMLYSDEIVPGTNGAWIRHKPGWDITRLRQSAYIGDWVWYSTRAIRVAGGFNAAMAGAEEYDMQLRFAAQGAKVERLPEAIFTRSAGSKRDDISQQLFCARAAEALKQHLANCGMKAEVQNRQYPGLFHHVRLTEDPGTTLIMLCDGADIPLLDKWMTALFTGKPLSGPVILAGADLCGPMQNYFDAVSDQREALEGKVLAVSALTTSSALAKAVALSETQLVVILDARMQEISPHWQEILRARLADSRVAAVAARTIVQTSADGQQGQVMGPLIIGADTRLGAGHGPLDPGPGGWLMVDQEASAISPPGLIARRAALSACNFDPDLNGDALWIDLSAQLRAQGSRLVWTPDVSLVMPPNTVPMADTESSFRNGSPAAQALSWADPYHHPALSLHGDLLAPERRTGLVRAIPTDPSSLLLSGDPAQSGAPLNAVRALRHAGLLEADWVQGLPGAAELGRRAPESWVRVNPLLPSHNHSLPYTALYTAIPEPDALPALAAAERIFATSPGLVSNLSNLTKASVSLWRPALSNRYWQDFESGKGLNTKPRILWIDEGISPPWFPELMKETLDIAAWMIVERPGVQYPEAVGRITPPETEQSWLHVLSQVGPQIMLRPMGADTHIDHYHALLAAAAGCRLIVDKRLDIPESLGALRLPNIKQNWSKAVQNAVQNLKETLRQGAQTRAAALALPSLEDEPPAWANVDQSTSLTLASAAE